MNGTTTRKAEGKDKSLMRRLGLRIALFFSIAFRNSHRMNELYVRYSPYLRGDSLMSLIAPEAHVFELRDPEVKGSTKLVNELISSARLQVEAAFNRHDYTKVGQHLLCPKALCTMGGFFETAVDMRAYGPRLTAPFDYVIENLPVVFADILSTDKDGRRILAGAEGSGIIDSSFTKHPVQVTIVIQGHEGGNWLAKGMLFPQDNVLDSNGNPCAKICHSEQVKGRMKSFSRSRSGVETGAIVNGVVVDESRLVVTETVHALCGVLRTFDKPGKSRLAGQCLGMFVANDKTKEIVLRSQYEYLQNFHRKGGKMGVLSKKLDTNPGLKILVRICERLDVDPLEVSFVRNFVDSAMGRKLYHFSQAAGMSCKTFVMRHDAGVPPGCVVVNMRGENNRKLRNGDHIAAARFPILMPNGLLKLSYISVDSPEVNLDHLLVDGVLPEHMMVVNPIDSAKMQADDDGDVAMLCTGPLLQLLDHKISLIQGSPDMEFLIEPEKFSDNPKGKIKVFENGSVNPDALDILSQNTQGPVGLLSNYCLYFMSLEMYQHALVMAVAIQEAIDGGKHAIMISDLDQLLDLNNWSMDSEGRLKPVDCAADPYGESLSYRGTLDEDYLHSWVEKEVTSWHKRKLKMREVLIWKTQNKRIEGGKWPSNTTPNQDLINYSAHTAKLLWNGYESTYGHKKESTPIDMKLVSALVGSFGYEVNSLLYSKTRYEYVLKNSGLLEFGSTSKSIMNKPDDGTRDVQIRGAEAILAIKLSKMPTEDLLAIFATEILGALKGESGKTVSKAFRAIAFPGSPVLEKLGIEVDEGCPFTNRDSIDAHLSEIRSWVTTGLYDCWSDAIAHWSDQMAYEHLEQTGVELHECECCNALIRTEVIQMVRSKKKERADSGSQKEASRLTSAINNGLRNNPKG